MVRCKIRIRIIPFNNGIIIRFQLKSMKKRKMKLKRIMIMMDTDSNDRYWIIEKKRKQIEKLASRGREGEGDLKLFRILLLVFCWEESFFIFAKGVAVT